MTMPELLTLEVAGTAALMTDECVGRGAETGDSAMPCPTRPDFRIGDSLVACSRHVALVLIATTTGGSTLTVTRL